MRRPRDEGNEPASEEDEEEGPYAPPGYGVRNARRRTNWLHRSDSLRRGHVRVMNERANEVQDLLD